MSKEPRYTLIGAFVVGAVCIIAGSVVFLGRGKFFEERKTYITFFSGSVKGLAVGSVVSFRGAQVGKVRDLSVVYQHEQDALIIPVLLDINLESIKGLRQFGDRSTAPDEGDLITRLVSRGLRAQLGLDSIVTGSLFVQLDFMPDIPVTLRSIDKRYPEIPSVPSSLEKLQTTLQQLPLAEISERTTRIATRLDEILSSPTIDASLTTLHRLLTDLDTLTHRFDERSASVTTEFASLSGAYRRTALQLVELAKQTETTLRALQATSEQGTSLAAGAHQTLGEIQATAKSLRRLADYLEQHPESIVRAKQ